MQGLLADLKRRKVYRAAATYAACAWAVMQAADFFFPILGLPDWSMTLLLFMSASGFPITLVLAWIFDFQGNKVVLEEDAPRQEETAPTASYLNILQLVLILILTATVGYLYYERLFLETEDTVSAAPAPVRALHSIAVLPFENMSADGENRYFSDGVSEELLNALAHVESLQVASRTSSFSFRDSEADAIEIGKALRVATLLEGSVRKDGNNLRITAQLIDTSNGYHLWSEVYDAPMENIFSLQDDISRQVVNAILPMITQEARLPMGPTTNSVVAYNEYLKGRALLREPATDLILQQAKAHFEKATATDPHYAEAWAGLCDTLLADYRHNNRSNYQTFLDGEKACGAAFTRSVSNEFSLDVQLALGVLYREAGYFEKSLNSLEAAKETRPESVRVLKELGTTYAAAAARGGDDSAVYLAKAQAYLDKAEQHLDKAIELEEESWDAHMALANFFFDIQEFDRATAVYDKVLTLNPGAIDALINKAAALHWLGDDEGAENMWRLAMEQSLATDNTGPLGLIYQHLGGLYYYRGGFERALDMYSAAEEYRNEDHVIIGRIAETYRALGDSTEERRHYKRAIGLAEEALRHNPDNWQTLGLLSIYYGFSGDSEKSTALAQKSLALDGKDPTAHYFAALAYWSGDRIDAAYAELSLASRSEYVRDLLVRDPDLQQLRALDERRFDDIVQFQAD